MKIGTMAFHWAINYGAVLQSYAMQQYLSHCGHNVEIINYVPFKSKLKSNLWLIKNMRFAALYTNILKQKKFNKFREKHMKLSKNKYISQEQLMKKPPEYDAYICGSDVVWNQSFALGGELKPTLSYFLNFVSNDAKRISYAASFGSTTLSSKMIQLIKPELEKFNCISVRENSGVDIVKGLGLDAKLAIDPTLLLKKSDYDKLLDCTLSANNYDLFIYILHSNQVLAPRIESYIFRKYFEGNSDKKYNGEILSVEEWISSIKSSKFVLTNSFHGAVFSVIYQKPFIVIPVEGSQMNDRIFTLLSNLGLEERIVDVYDEDKIDIVMQKPIDWELVETKLKALQKDSISYLNNALNY
jgi:hypothetical protein